MPIDAMSFASQVFNRAMEKAGQTGLVSPVLDEAGRTDLMVDALASYLLQLLGLAPSPHAAGASPGTSELERVCTEQGLRNRAVARALGACECWGELATCALCRGRGVPGWRPPDRVSFNLLVRPVLHKMKQQRLRARRTAKLS